MIIKNREELLSVGDREGRALALDILEGGLAAADPYENTRKLIRVEGNRLLVGGQPGMDVGGFGDEVIDLSEVRRIYVIGAGKAVQRQAKALEDIFGDRLTAGAVTVKKGEGCQLERIQVAEGAHPVPDEQSVAGAERIAAIARAADEHDLVFTLFSDGASSLFALPAPGLTLDDVRQVFFLAIKYGSQRLIHEVMPYLSAVNHGRILRLIHPARTVNLIMQVGVFPRWRGQLPEGGMWVPSWPPARRRMATALKELRARPWYPEFTPALRALLESGDPRYDVPDLEDFRQLRFSFWQPIDPLQMVEGARATAERLGLKGVTVCAELHAHSAAAASVLANLAREVEVYRRPFAPPVALVTGGHLDVPIGNATGVGGRNQEFTLLWARDLGAGRLVSQKVIVAALDSDGTDGPGTQHVGGSGEFLCMAGGVVDDSTAELARMRGVDLNVELANHNSTVALMRLNSAIYTGNTGACLGDLRVAIVR